MALANGTAEPTPLSVVIWRDSDVKGTVFLSTCHDPTEEQQVTRRKAGQASVNKPAPLVAAEYNRHMGFCDSCNHMKRNYSIQLIHRRRWYMCMIYYILELSIINSLIIYRAHRHSSITHLDFRKKLILQLFGRNMCTGGEPQAKRIRISKDQLPEVRLTHGGHLVTRHPKPEGAMCKLCYMQKAKSTRSRYWCSLCQVPLHPDTCFYEYHTMENQ